MTDPKQVRINDAEDPDRSDKFQKALKRTETSGNGVLRQLIDSFIRYVDQHGHSPSFPVDIVPRAPDKPPRDKRG